MKHNLVALFGSVSNHFVTPSFNQWIRPNEFVKWDIWLGQKTRSSGKTDGFCAGME